MMYKVTAAIDSLDPNPEVFLFDEFVEAADFISEEIERRLDWAVQHSQYSVSEKELEEMRENELTLFRLEETDDA